MRKQWQCMTCILACILAAAHVASAEDVLYKINTAWTDEAAFEASADRPQGYTWNVDAFGSLRDATEAVGAGSRTFEFTHASDAWMTLGAASLKGFASVAVTQSAKALADFEVGDTASVAFGIAAAKPVVIAVTTAKDTDAYVMEARTVDVNPNSKTAVDLTPAAAGETASATGHVGYRTGTATYEVDVPAGQSGIYTFALQVTDSYTDDGGNTVAYGSRGYVSFTLETVDGKTVAEFGDTNAQARRSVELAAGTYIATVDSTDHGAGAQNASFTIAVTAGKVNDGVTLGDNSMEDTDAVLTLSGADGARSATLSGFVGLGDDQDWLLLENVESGRYTLTFDTLEGLDDDDTVHGAHVYLYRLYTPADGVVRRKAVADTVFRGTATAIEGIVLDAAETYYLQILCPGGFASANDATYTLKLQETASFDGVSDADDSWKTPTTMTPATTFSEYVGGEDACDWYMLDLDSSKTWKGRLDITREEGVLFVEIGSRKAGERLVSPKTQVTYQLRDDDPFQQDLEFDAGNDYFIRFYTSNGNDTRYEAKFSLLFYLKYTLSPDDATWTVDGALRANGETAILVAGDYEVTFTDVPHFVTPAAETVTMNEDKALTKAYDAGYTLSYTLSHDDATWTVGGTTYKSGETTRTMLPGTYEVTFSDVDHFVTPDPETVNLNADLVFNRTYEAGYTLSYTLTPNTATWTVNNNTYASGATSKTLLPGSHQVTFSDAADYDTPAAETVTLNADTQKSKTYELSTRTLKYTLTPDTATWTVDGKTYASGATATLKPATYTVSFSDEWGYEKPSAESVTLTSNTVKTVSYADGLYLMVDLSKGTSATSYPYTFSATGPDVSLDACRTTQLWLRKIPKGTFTMGSPSGEVGRVNGFDMAQHQVTLKDDYYIGVFACTQRQWELVMGTKPSYFSNADCYATRPVEQVSYDMIRGTGAQAGAGWPTCGHTVDSGSFMGVIQKKTGLVLDLPTEAQWEYACRKKADGNCWETALNSGKNLTGETKCDNVAAVGRYWHNGGSKNSESCSTESGTAKVGSYQPSGLGLYDMHGNVSEWCLDWRGASTTSTAEETDPEGPTDGSCRVLRGGSWCNYAATAARRTGATTTRRTAPGTATGSAWLAGP